MSGHVLINFDLLLPSLMLFHLMFTFLVSRSHPPFPTHFELSDPSGRCRIFNRSAFSQKGCGACAAFAVSTTFAMRECVQRGEDFIPSPYWLFNCGKGECQNGSFVGSLVGVLNGAGRMEDIDDINAVKEFGKPCDVHVKHGRESGSGRGVRFPTQTVFRTLHDDELVLKTELFVFKNPVMAVVKPDLGMSVYPFKRHAPDFSLKRGDYYMWARKKNRDGTFSRNRILFVKKNGPIPVYHISEETFEQHLIVILGWGSDPEPHWIIQNSWGTEWGERGRGKLAMNDVLSACILVSGALTDMWLLFYLILFIGVFFAAWELVSLFLGKDDCGGLTRIEKFDDVADRSV
jgi:hypothetical protein